MAVPCYDRIQTNGTAEASSVIETQTRTVNKINALTLGTH